VGNGLKQLVQIQVVDMSTAAYCALLLGTKKLVSTLESVRSRAKALTHHIQGYNDLVDILNKLDQPPYIPKALVHKHWHKDRELSLDIDDETWADLWIGNHWEDWATLGNPTGATPGWVKGLNICCSILYLLTLDRIAEECQRLAHEEINAVTWVEDAFKVSSHMWKAANGKFLGFSAVQLAPDTG
jgi:hypothetical protein